ncbi:MAG: hypothetical protein AAFZ87_07475 [Planctomycetota bacterium]
MDRPAPRDTPAHAADARPTPARETHPLARFGWAAGGAAAALVAAELLGSAFAAGPAAPAAPQTQTQDPTFTRSVSIAGNGGMSADSNHRMIAVTGVDITGQSVLYLIDTIDKQLAVYQASGGAPGTQSIRLVGARRIDLDLQLEGLNDKTSVDGRALKYSDLERAFAREVDGSK